MVNKRLVTVVICAYSSKRRALLDKAIESVLAQSHGPIQLVVVIDHNDALRSDIARKYSGVEVIANAGPQGLAAARNTGVAAAQGEVVCFLDDDAVAEKAWVENLVRHYASADVIGTGGKIIPVWQGRGRPAWFPAEFDWVIGCTYQGHPEALTAIRNPIGCNMSMRRSVFVEIGGFDGATGRRANNAAGCEETELFIRASQAIPRAQVLYDPRAVVHHSIEADRVSWRYFCRRCWAEGRSKRLVAQRVGSGDGLSSERNYVRAVLPRAVMRSIFAALKNRTFSPLSNIAGILTGFCLTALGYITPKQSTI
jgi:glycosyltransferase involved in cell wall biosynthesis